MAAEEILNKLKKEGYKEVYVWEDTPKFVYDKHCHEYETKLVMLAGSMTLWIDDNKIEFNSGDELIIPAWKYHSANVGDKGAKYVVGEDKE